jgi:hypothetical protein
MPTTKDVSTARFMSSMERAAARMRDEELTAELTRMRRCALCLTRSRRDLALMQIRCLECELERRGKDLPLHG